MNTSDILNKAADLIEERGWTRGSGGWKGIDGYCLEGGIAAAAGFATEDGQRFAFYECEAYRAVCDYLERTPQPAACPISNTLWQWNDAGTRTATEVVEVLRATAVIEAARERTADHPDLDVPNRAALATAVDMWGAAS